MYKYCKNLKKKKNKPYCNVLKKEITLSLCSKCVNKEYKKSTYKWKKIHKSGQIAKLERKRTSVFTDDLEHCLICGAKKEELHEIFAGRNRINSMKYGFVLPLCHKCHFLNQNNSFFNDFWHKNCQEYWECNIGSRNEFIKVFRRNYLNLKREDKQ